MSFRPVLVLAALLSVACDQRQQSGPEQSRTNVFSYLAPIPAGQTVAIRNMSGELTIEPAADDTLRVVADVRWRGDTTLPTDVSFRGNPTPNGALICAVFGEGRCTVDDYDGSAQGGDVSFRRGNVNLGLGGGSQAQVHFRVQVPAGVKLDLVMVDGSLTSASSAPVQARGVNGEMRIVTSVGPVNAQTMNGDVDVRMTSLSGTDSVKVGTLNGNAYLFLPEGVAATVDVATTNGTLLTDFPGVAGRDKFVKSISAVLGAGTTPVRVRSVNGDAQLRRLDAQGRAYEIATP